MTAPRTRERPQRGSRAPDVPSAVARPACSPTSVLRVSLLEESDVVVHGVRRVLRPYSDRVRVDEPEQYDALGPPSDLVLFDCFPVPGLRGTTSGRPRPGYARGRVVGFSWETRASCVTAALQHGYAGFVAKSLSGPDLVAALETVAAVTGVAVAPLDPRAADDEVEVVWPGDDQALTARECEVIGLITRGVANAEIADLLHLSINSVKSYIRSAYRKIGTTSRAQAVLWGVEHGFGAERAKRPTARSARERVS